MKLTWQPLMNVMPTKIEDFEEQPQTSGVHIDRFEIMTDSSSSSSSSSSIPLPKQDDREPPSVWIFGYGSLIWNPGFKYAESRRVRLDGHQRVFWQGNMTYRGTQKLPGRVVTITKKADKSVYGLAFRVEGTQAIQEALDHLKVREIESGYVYQLVQLHPVLLGDGGGHHSTAKSSFLGLTCTAKWDNEFFVGGESLERMASEIAVARGKAGPNRDYLFGLADAMRQHFPSVPDHHLFTLESLVRGKLSFSQQN